MSHKQQLEKHFEGLSEETIIDTLRLMDNITYTPDFYDYVAADVCNVMSILLFYKPSNDFFANNVYSKTDCKFDIEHFNYHEKLDDLGIFEPTDLQKRYLIFPSFNELTGNLRIVYFYNNVLSGSIHSSKHSYNRLIFKTNSRQEKRFGFDNCLWQRQFQLTKFI